MDCQSQPFISVQSVKKSSQWYQKVLGCESGHGGDEYERLVEGDRILLQLHAWDLDHDHHSYMGKKSIKSRGNGVVLWFMVNDFDARVKAIKKLNAKILEDVAINPNAQHREICLQDPDGYVVILASRYGDLGKLKARL